MTADLIPDGLAAIAYLVDIDSAEQPQWQELAGKGRGRLRDGPLLPRSSS
jgi:hypothetical protein